MFGEISSNEPNLRLGDKQKRFFLLDFIEKTFARFQLTVKKLLDSFQKKLRRFPAPPPVAGLGGAQVLYGQGTYGCLSGPPFLCQDDTDLPPDNLISKVMREDEARIEMDAGTVAAQYDILACDKHLESTGCLYQYGVYPVKMCLFPVDNEAEWSRWVSARDKQGKKCEVKTESNVTGQPATDLYDKQGNARNGGKLAQLLIPQAQGDLSSVAAYLQKRGYLTGNNVLSWFKGLQNVLQGLRHFHSKAFYHLDVHSPNILFFGDIRQPTSVKLGDFGTAGTSETPKTLRAPALNLFWDYFPPEARIFASCLHNKVDPADAEANFPRLYTELTQFYARDGGRPYKKYILDAKIFGSRTPRYRNLAEISAAIDMFGFVHSLLESGMWDFAVQIDPKLKINFDFLWTHTRSMLFTDDEVVLLYDAIVAQLEAAISNSTGHTFGRGERRVHLRRQTFFNI